MPRTRAPEDGCVSCDQLAGIVEHPAQSIRFWVKTGLVEPQTKGEGQGNHSRYNLTDVTAVRAIVELRRQGVSLQALRKVHTLIASRGESFGSCRLAAVRFKAKQDVFLLVGKRDREKLMESLLEKPGQTVLAQVALDKIAKETQRRFAGVIALNGSRRVA